MELALAIAFCGLVILASEIRRAGSWRAFVARHVADDDPYDPSTRAFVARHCGADDPYDQRPGDDR